MCVPSTQGNLTWVMLAGCEIYQLLRRYLWGGNRSGGEPAGPHPRRLHRGHLRGSGGEGIPRRRTVEWGR